MIGEGIEFVSLTTQSPSYSHRKGKTENARDDTEQNQELIHEKDDTLKVVWGRRWRGETEVVWAWQEEEARSVWEEDAGDGFTCQEEEERKT